MKELSHSEKFKRWQKHVCKQTRFLSTLVEEKIAKFFEDAGFMRVDMALNRPEEAVSMDEIRLERVVSDGLDSVFIFFAKHGEPKFQIGFSRRQLKFPNEFISSARLVKKSSQYYYFWGKPWWLPIRFWSDHMARRSVERVVPLLPQILVFLNEGKRGANIGMEV